MEVTVDPKIEVVLGIAPACTSCGIRGIRTYYQNDPYCLSCMKVKRAEHKAIRANELATLPRCEFCNKRGTWNVGAGAPVLLCGWCFKKAKRHTVLAHGNFMAMHTYTGSEIRAVLEGLEGLKK